MPWQAVQRHMSAARGIAKEQTTGASGKELRTSLQSQDHALGRPCTEALARQEQPRGQRRRHGLGWRGNLGLHPGGRHGSIAA